MASKQILVALAAVSNPVKPSDAKTLAANMAALGNLSRQDLKAISALGLIYELNHNGGTNYLANHAQLRIDANSLFAAFPRLEADEPLQKTQIQAALDWNAGFAADNAIGTDVWGLMTNAGKLRVMPENSLNRILFFLRYKLAV